MKTHTDFENELSFEDLIEIFNQKSNNTDAIPEIEVWCSQIDEMF